MWFLLELDFLVSIYGIQSAFHACTVPHAVAKALLVTRGRRSARPEYMSMRRLRAKMLLRPTLSASNDDDCLSPILRARARESFNFYLIFRHPDERAMYL